jgi:oxepin-CoA hydrolase/3-oxo-5,6-dehydrosuberyl-CoA semialdehyde dehydrogenase
VLVPADRIDAVAAELADRLGAIQIGDPAAEGVRMGPLATAQQRDDVKAGIERLAAATDEIYGGHGSIDPMGGVGFFVGPVLRRARDAGASEIHDREVFGPAATLIGYRDLDEAWRLVALGGGGLVASVYSDDRDTLGAAALELAPYHGRLYLGSQKMAAQSPGPGTVLPQLSHGGPGRAGGGEELGGLRGLGIYQQRVALQGDKSILKSIAG